MRHDRKITLLLTFPLMVLLGMTGCGSVLPTQLETKLASNGNAEDHMAAAMLYQKKAEALKAKANQYETEASRIGQLEDPKGFRRQALEVAAEENRQKARQMEELYAAHFEKAQTRYGKKSPD